MWRISRRGVALILLGVMWILAGYGYMADPPAETASQGVRVLLSVAPFAVWGATWMMLGAIALVTAFLRGLVVPMALGFGAVMIPPALWCGANVVAYWHGYDGGLRGAAIFTAFMILILVVAGIPESRR